MLYKTAGREHHWRERQADTNDISIKCGLGMGAAIQKTYGNKVYGVDAATQLRRP